MLLQIPVTREAIYWFGISNAENILALSTLKALPNNVIILLNKEQRGHGSDLKVKTHQTQLSSCP